MNPDFQNENEKFLFWSNKTIFFHWYKSKHYHQLWKTAGPEFLTRFLTFNICKENRKFSFLNTLQFFPWSTLLNTICTTPSTYSVPYNPSMMIFKDFKQYFTSSLFKQQYQIVPFFQPFFMGTPFILFICLIIKCHILSTLFALPDYIQSFYSAEICILCFDSLEIFVLSK